MESNCTHHKVKTDVGCQTDPSALPKFDEMLSLAAGGSYEACESLTETMTTTTTTTTTVSTQPVNDSEGSKNTPAGVKPHLVAEYFAEKQMNRINSSTTTAPKMRTCSTTGVVGEGTKCVRSAGMQQQGSSTTGNGKANTGIGNTDVCWDDDKSKLRLEIKNFSKLDETLCSSAKIMEGVSWKIMVMPKQHLVQKKQQKCMGFFLQCSPQMPYSDQWSVQAVADMRMLSCKPGVQHFTRKTTHTYTAKENDWGYSCFMTWADILDENQGYINNDTIILEICVKAEAPKNMMSRKDFVEKIEKWIKLADMQMKKGNIDLAIEANSNAIKFCKDKDAECIRKLKAQKEEFVNAKLFESIERIEKGKAPVACSDANHGKPTSLRQALTGAQKSLNGKMTSKGGKKTRAVVTVQQMKKKKPYEQNNVQQPRQTSGCFTVRGQVEKRKNSKTDSTTKSEKDKEKESVLEKIEENNDSRIEKGVHFETEKTEKDSALYLSEDDDDDYEDEEVYNEGDYVDQVLDESDANSASDQYERFDIPQLSLSIMNNHEGGEEWHSSCEDLTFENDTFESRNEQGILMISRTTQTIYSGAGPIGKSGNTVTVDSSLHEHPPVKKIRDLEDQVTREAVVEMGESKNADLMNSAFTMLGRSGHKFVDIETGSFLPTPSNYSKFMEIIQKTEEFNRFIGMNESDEVVDKVLFEEMSGLNLNDLPNGFPSSTIDARVPNTEFTRNAQYDHGFSDLLLKRWFDIEGVLMRDLKEDSIFSKLDDEDRIKLLEEIKCKANPLVATLDLEFRDSCRLAEEIITNGKRMYNQAMMVLNELSKLTKYIDEKLIPAIGLEEKKKGGKKGSPVKEKTATSAAATSALKTNVTGRPTVIAKRTMKNIEGQNARIDTDIDVEGVEIPNNCGPKSMRDSQASFRGLNHSILTLLSYMHGCSTKIMERSEELFSDKGILNELKVSTEKNDEVFNKLLAEINKVKSENEKLTAEKEKLESRLGDILQTVKQELEKNTKMQKEAKDIRNQLKKAENKAIKEENRATTLQFNLNSAEEKIKLIKKESENAKKKAAEERNKAKNEKDRDAQLIRQQTTELADRENDRDKYKKELEESQRIREKIDKERRQTHNQLNNALERARNAEIVVLESKMKGAVEEMRVRKEEIIAGYSETEQNLNRVRQASDHEVLRKSLAEWKSAIEKFDGLIISLKNEYDQAIEQIKAGNKTLAQIGDIKLPAKFVLPKLVKPPPVQVVAPSSTFTSPVILSTPSVGVIGQPRTPSQAQNRNQQCEPSNVSSCSTPTRNRVSRLPSPVGTSSKPSTTTTTRDEANPLWSWNTIGDLGALRQPGGCNSSMDALQQNIWAANGNAFGSIGNGFMRSGSTLGVQSNPTQPHQYMRPSSQQPVQAQNSVTSMTNMQRLHSFGDIWTNTNNQSIPDSHMMFRSMAAQHSGAGDAQNVQSSPYGSVGMNTSNANTWRHQQAQPAQNPSSNHGQFNPQY